MPGEVPQNLKAQLDDYAPWAMRTYLFLLVLLVLLLLLRDELKELLKLSTQKNKNLIYLLSIRLEEAKKYGKVLIVTNAEDGYQEEHWKNFCRV